MPSRRVRVIPLVLGNYVEPGVRTKDESSGCVQWSHRDFTRWIWTIERLKVILIVNNDLGFIFWLGVALIEAGYRAWPACSTSAAISARLDGFLLAAQYTSSGGAACVERGKKPVAMVATTEETSTPVTVAGPREIAFLIGPIPRATIAFADVETGRITHRIAPDKGEIVSLAASPDGGTLYFGTGGTIWSIPSAGGQARKIRAGDRVVADPSGRALLVTILESPNMRLFRVPLDGSPETEIAADASHAPRYSHLSPGSWNADGRLLVSLHETWFAAPAVLDTRNGHGQPLPFDKTSDYANMAWLPDGRMVALRISMRSTLWRFVPAQE